MTQLTKTSSIEEVKAYFNAVLKLSQPDKIRYNYGIRN